MIVATTSSLIRLGESRLAALPRRVSLRNRSALTWCDTDRWRFVFADDEEDLGDCSTILCSLCGLCEGWFPSSSPLKGKLRGWCYLCVGGQLVGGSAGGAGGGCKISITSRPIRDGTRLGRARA